MEQVKSKDGTIISFNRSGTGRPLLLVHGTAADHRRWSGVSPQLEEHFTVYAIDRRGRSESGDSPNYHIMREAEDIAAVVKYISGRFSESVSVLAHSYGAVCTLEASFLTNKIYSLILYEPPIPAGLPTYPPSLPAKIQAAADSGDLEKGLELFMREVVRMPDQEFTVYRQLPAWPNRVKLVPTIAREMTLDQTYIFEPERFANNYTPTLLLLGGDSPPLFKQAIEALEKSLPIYETAILPNQQHIAMDTAPELFVEVVLEYLQR